MAVYVDDVAIPYGRMKMCHMWADSREELLAMADRIGVARRWLQQPPKASWVHFDISQSKRAMAVQDGAVECDRYEALAHAGRQLIALGEEECSPGLIASGQRKLDLVAKARALKVGESAAE
ncbi:DUF4031 domain-containing protein [Fodinicurvata fenggangensis]|uniref:DUF4031 domain-containing protein n=1 Tax=Fodinicurvata fenggangensis TaxID=1121830 RepID=UPI00047A9CEB|nr:DUF4031 domain-containing protein [Fodinicurvata fenggangensis]